MILPQYTPTITTSNHINGDTGQNAGKEIPKGRKRKNQAEHYDNTAKAQKVRPSYLIILSFIYWVLTDNSHFKTRIQLLPDDQVDHHHVNARNSNSNSSSNKKLKPQSHHHLDGQLVRLSMIHPKNTTGISKRLSMETMRSILGTILLIHVTMGNYWKSSTYAKGVCYTWTLKHICTHIR